MSKLNQLIQLKDLAKAYSSIISNLFDIKVNVSTNVDPLRPEAIMFATRQPYKISNIKAESLQVALRFYVCCENEDNYNDTIKLLSQLVGLNKGTLTSQGNTFKYFSFLDFARPLSDPEVNSGKFYQTLELMGTCLVTQTTGGVLIANEVTTSITFNKDALNEITGPIEVLSATTALVKAQEAPQMANAVVGKAVNLGQTFSYSYTILLLKNAVCERIVKALENIDPIGVNEAIEITDTYPPFTGSSALTSTKTVVLTGGQTNRNAGTFMTAQLTFQDKLEIETAEQAEEYQCYVALDSNITVTEIVGHYQVNQSTNSITCDVGTVIKISYDALSYNLNYSGVQAVRTSASNVVTPKTYDMTVTSTVASIGTTPANNGGGGTQTL